MQPTYAQQFEAARHIYNATRDVYRITNAEEDRIKTDEAFRAWLATSQVFIRRVGVTSSRLK